MTNSDLSQVSLRTVRSLILGTALAIGLGLFSGRAEASSTLGEVNSLAGSSLSGCAPGCSFVQTATGPGTPSYDVPAGGGVITSWSIRIGQEPVNRASRARIFAVTTGGNDARLEGVGSMESLAANKVNTFAATIPVTAGSKIGLEVNEAVPSRESNGEDEIRGFVVPGSVGQTSPFGVRQIETALNLSASVEPDADHDGLGDETQDPDVEVVESPPADPGPDDTDTDDDGIADSDEAARGTEALDADSDDDGIADGAETKTDPATADTDGDKLPDGLERGFVTPVADPDGPATGTELASFRPDKDPRTKTNPVRRDTDRDRIADGREDRNHDGKRQRRKETDPRKRDTDHDRIGDRADAHPLSRG